MFNRFGSAGQFPFRLLWLCILLSSFLFAQSERGTITGAVRDASGAVIPGAKVTITNTATNTSTTLTSNESGEFTAPNLASGNYNVRVEKDGFRPSDLKSLTLSAASTVRADAALEVGTSTQAVEVQATAATLQTEDSKTSVTIENKLVNDLPLVVGGAVRSPFDLAILTPESKNLGGDNGFSLGGGQAASYGTTLDGVSTNTTRSLQKSWVASNAPSIEAITEFTVDTNGYKAEYGHAGGGVMTFVSKSGTNSLHGSAYEFLRNNDFDANNFFSNAAGRKADGSLKQPIPIYKQNDFGFTVGGPVYIPKVYHGRNKTFFFFSYEGFRNRNGASNFSATVPTPEMYMGDFSKWVDSTGKQIPIFDPTSQTADASGNIVRKPFAGNIIPQSLFSPAAQKAISVFQSSGVLKSNNGAVPGTPAYINNNFFVTSGSQVQPVNKYSIKGDHVFSEKHRISGYYGNDRESVVPGPEGPPTLPGLYTNYNDLQQASDVVRFSWDWTLGPTKFNHFYAGDNNWRQNHNPPQEYIGNWKNKFCLGGVPDCNQNLVNLNFSSNGYTGWGGPANNGSENTIYSYNDDFTWIRGKHSFKLGGMYQLGHYNGFGRQCISGCATFNFAETGVPGGTNPNAGGNAFASLLLGYADTGSIDTVRFIGQQWPYFAGYFQDDWRITPKLVLNLGLRWETTLPPTGLGDKWSDFSPTTPNPGAGNIAGALIYAGSGAGRQGSRTLADSYFGAFGPHIGGAYSWNSKTVVRSSYARSFGAITTVTGSTHQRGFTQTYTAPQSTGGIQPAFTLDGGFPPYPVPPFISPSFANGDNIPWWQGKEATRPPEFNNFNFSIQRQIGSSMVLETSYNGVIGSHLQSQLLNYDQVNPQYLTAFGTVAQSTAVLNSKLGSPLANAAGIGEPYPGFIRFWGNNATVKQALRPYPQYNGIDTYGGGGDHSGHSSYHAAIISFQKRYAAGLTFQTSYVFSKLLTDSDSYWGNGSTAADQYNRRLEKSIGQFDVTHNFKLGLVYDLPFGKGRKYLTSGVGAWVVGGWRINSTNFYSSGQPISLSSSYGLPLFNGRSTPYITSYSGWRAPTKGSSFDPQVDNFLVPYGTGPFPLQGLTTADNGFGNSTRYNPKVRQFPNLTENMSVARTFPIHESVRLEFRAEAFNVFNRVRFGTGSTNIQDTNFGHLTSSGDLLNSPRQLQLALKLYF
ncbi:MAG: carboxypeptidase regulatory-like domain-containing protein [Bryobacteraceae bacterium]